jgi:hypothetical protein
MTSDRDLLAQGGITSDDIDALVAHEDSHGAARFQPLANPEAAEEIGQRLAAQLASLEPDRLLVAGQEHDDILAFVVARELHCPVTIVWHSEGLLSHEGDIERADRIAVVSESFRAPASLHALGTYVKGLGASIAAVAALIDTPVLQREAKALGAAAIALVSRP